MGLTEGLADALDPEANAPLPGYLVEEAGFDTPDHGGRGTYDSSAV